ncbi:hypothetical protein BDB13_5760 [Rhodococcus sp. OK302]|nr:hypothetical protein BDB13_5760 [Rhodococcus sp. OK302]
MQACSRQKAVLSNIAAQPNPTGKGNHQCPIDIRHAGRRDEIPRTHTGDIRKSRNLKGQGRFGTFLVTVAGRTAARLRDVR